MFNLSNLTIAIPTKSDDSNLISAKSLHRICICPNIFVIDSGFHQSTFDICNSFDIHYISFGGLGHSPKKKLVPNES